VGRATQVSCGLCPNQCTLPYTKEHQPGWIQIVVHIMCAPGDGTQGLVNHKSVIDICPACTERDITKDAGEFLQKAKHSVRNAMKAESPNDSIIVIDKTN
jgi:hypothetical protein